MRYFKYLILTLLFVLVAELSALAQSTADTLGKPIVPHEILLEDRLSEADADAEEQVVQFDEDDVSEVVSTKEANTATESPAAPKNYSKRSRNTTNLTTLAQDAFKRYLERDSYYSEDAIESFCEQYNSYCEEIKNRDYLSAGEYVEAMHLADSLVSAEAELNSHRASTQQFIQAFFQNNSRYNNDYIKHKVNDELKSILEGKLKKRENAIITLKKTMRDGLAEPDKTLGDWLKAHKDLMLYCSTALAAVLLLLLLIILLKRAIAAKSPTVIPKENKQVAGNDGAPIVVRRKTTSILKKQSLEDVQGNGAYMAIDTSDFCCDSSVRRIYIKNSCIKEIYNMYADDLRNPANPKEDGCMVLGRWVEDAQNGEYYVSLEYVVHPGDDAVFQEYELNFGGKIKLRVADKLRRLRRETELQYDLTCWVHSHPGLGVFFSNSDNGVHLQLKHPSHPEFLTAIVVDILTPTMELGVFTFKKRDLQINSKKDLLRMYSLEDWYKWALDSERSSYREEDYYDALVNASKRDKGCVGIKLNNGAIIDACQILENTQPGSRFNCGGFCINGDKGVTSVVEKVSSEDTDRGLCTNGYLIVGNHLSIPSIKKLVGSSLGNIHFVLFYSLIDVDITCIPVIEGEITMDEEFYSKLQLEELKIWTRRKR